MTVILIAIIAAVIGLDQLTKWLTVVYLDYQESFPLWEGVFHFTHEINTGMAFGMMKDHRWVFMVFSSVAIVAMIVYLFRFRPESRWMQVAMAFIIGGGIGNMIDRIFLGYVVDFLDFTLINFAVFNVADSFVCIGAGMMIIALVIDLVREIKLESEKKKAVANNAADEKNENDTNVES